LRFFKTVIMPLLPREAKLSFDHDSVVQWRGLLEANRREPASQGEPGGAREAREVTIIDVEEPSSQGNAEPRKEATDVAKAMLVKKETMLLGDANGETPKSCESNHRRRARRRGTRRE
jgi:hypothetical protein